MNMNVPARLFPLRFAPPLLKEQARLSLLSLSRVVFSVSCPDRWIVDVLDQHNKLHVVTDVQLSVGRGDLGAGAGALYRAFAGGLVLVQQAPRASVARRHPCQ